MRPDTQLDKENSIGKMKREKKLACRICRKRYVLQCYLNDHLKITHGIAGSFEEKTALLVPKIVPKSNFVCMFCNLPYPSKQGLLNHVNSKHFEQIESIKAMMRHTNSREFILTPSTSPPVIVVPPVCQGPSLPGKSKKRGFTIKELLDLE